MKSKAGLEIQHPKRKGMEVLSNFITGMGVGMVIGFLVSLKLIPDNAPLSYTFGFYLVSMVVGGVLFLRLDRAFRSAPLAYLGSFFAILTLEALTNLGHSSGEVLFLLVLISVIPLAFVRPGGIIDVFLAGVNYFGGVLTGLALLGTLNLLNNIGVALGSAVMGMAGAVASLATSAFAFLMKEKPKP